MIPKPTTELEINDSSGFIIICHNQGVCKALTLNETAYNIWKSIDGKRNIDEIAELVRSTYEKENILDINKDIMDFIDELCDEGFIELYSSI